VQSAPLAAPAAEQPALPDAPPARPAAAGAPPPAAEVRPIPAPAAAVSAEVAFAPGASALSPIAGEEAKAFAAKRGNGVIVVTGFGDPGASDPAAQSAALALGLARAQSVAAALQGAGVPAAAIRVNAEASGRGASLRLLQ
jgi:hypothetical protein